jgi:hypothetical protein
MRNYLYLCALSHGSTPAVPVSFEGAVLRETQLRMRLWTNRIGFTERPGPKGTEPQDVFSDERATVRHG